MCVCVCVLSQRKDGLPGVVERICNGNISIGGSSTAAGRGIQNKDNPVHNVKTSNVGLQDRIVS